MPVPCILIVWLAITNPGEGGKVIIKAELQGVEFYLDGNFVAKTEPDGTLRIDSLPSGTFRYSLSKKGFVSHEGSFSLAEGETRMLEVKLESLGDPEMPDSSSGRVPSKRAAAKPNPAPETQSAPAGRTPVESGIPSAPAVGAEAKPPDEESFSGAWIAAGILLTGSAGAFMFWIYRRRKTRQAAALDPLALLTPFPESPPEAAPESADPKQTPEFIHKLKQREELMKAGFVGATSREVERTNGKEREVVIVLPKEAYRYEEENDDTSDT
jgi:hypothetical protein